MNKMRIGIILIVLFGWFGTSVAQSFKSIQSEVVFFSSAPLEDIKATNSKITGLFNAGTGAIAFVAPIKAFRFRRSLMQEHFNEKFMESDRFPNATFEGKLTGYERMASGEQQVVAEGRMTIHGVTQKVAIKGNLLHESGSLKMGAKFPIRLEDYKISIPKILFQNIAEEVEVTISFVFRESN